MSGHKPCKLSRRTHLSNQNRVCVALVYLDSRLSLLRNDSPEEADGSPKTNYPKG